MNPAKIYYIVFGILTIVGGVVGYMKGSKASLIAGGVCGVLLLVAAFLFAGSAQWALFLGLIVSVALAGKFIPDLLQKGGVFPAGVMAALSIVSIGVTIYTWTTWLKK